MGPPVCIVVNPDDPESVQELIDAVPNLNEEQEAEEGGLQPTGGLAASSQSLKLSAVESIPEDGAPEAVGGGGGGGGGGGDLEAVAVSVGACSTPGGGSCPARPSASTPWSNASSESAASAPMPAATSPSGALAEAVRSSLASIRVASPLPLVHPQPAPPCEPSPRHRVILPVGFNLSRHRSRQIITGGESQSSLANLRGVSSPNSRASFRAGTARSGDSGDALPTARLSFARGGLSEAVAQAIPGISSLDVRVPNDRPSRASTMLNYLAAMSGGQQAAFLYDPEDRRRKDRSAAQRAANRRSFAREAAQLRASSFLPAMARPRAVSQVEATCTCTCT